MVGEILLNPFDESIENVLSESIWICLGMGGLGDLKYNHCLTMKLCQTSVKSLIAIRVSISVVVHLLQMGLVCLVVLMAFLKQWIQHRNFSVLFMGSNPRYLTGFTSWKTPDTRDLLT